MRFLRAVAVSLLATIAGAIDYTLCGDDHLGITAVGLDPSPVQPGAPVTVSFTGSPDRVIPDEPVNVQVGIYLLGFKVAEADFNFCTDLQGVQCPVNASQTFTGSLSYNIPQEAPGGLQVETKVKVEADGLQYTCVDVHVKVQQALGRDMHDEGPVVSQALVDRVNSAEDPLSWTAEVSPRFEGYTLADMRRVAGGTVMRGHKGYEELPRKTYAGSVLKGVQGDIPASFDARTAWPECAEVIGHVRDQSDCGSCWAFASTEAFNDRYCIKNGGSDKVLLSAEDTTACCHGITCGFSDGCNGGQPGSAWSWFRHKGVVSGGDFSDMGKGKTCKPYEFQPCAHHVPPGSSGYPSCPEGEYPTPVCSDKCSENAFPAAYLMDKRVATSSYSLRNVADIQRDLMEHGSVTAAFNVYEDFPTYKGGVYEHVTGNWLGGHAVKIVGWGLDEKSGKPYWLVMNSWNNSWGEKGLFRILRGSNHCGIEGEVVAGEV